jgi:membrane protease YdiL (CAAX protease family)
MMADWLRLRPITRFFALAYGISWGGILIILGISGFDLTGLTPQGMAFVILFMLLGPSASGLVMTALQDGKTGLRETGLRFIFWKSMISWHAIALLTVPILILAILWFLGAFVDPAFLPRFKLQLAFFGLIAGAFEEIGWTGFATPRLLKAFNVPTAGLVLGLVWAMWHALADFVGNFSTMGVGWIARFFVFWLATLPPYRLLMTWVYSRTQSLPLGILMHASYTGSLLSFFPATSFEQGLIWQAIFAISLWIVAGVAWKYGKP